MNGSAAHIKSAGGLFFPAFASFTGNTTFLLLLLSLNTEISENLIPLSSFANNL